MAKVVTSKMRHEIEGSSGLLDQALLGVVQLAIAPLATQLVAVEAELARLRVALQDSKAALGSRKEISLERHDESSRSCAHNFKIQEVSPNVKATKRSLSPRECRRTCRGFGEVDSSTEYPRGALVVEVDAEHAELLRGNAAASSSTAELQGNSLEQVSSTGRCRSPSVTRTGGKDWQSFSAAAFTDSSPASTAVGTTGAHITQTPLSGSRLRQRASSSAGRLTSAVSSSSTTEDLLNVTTRFRDDGITLCRMRDYGAAAQHYTKAIEELSERASDSAWPPRAWSRPATAHSFPGSAQKQSGSAPRVGMEDSNEVVSAASPPPTGFKRLSDSSRRGKLGSSEKGS